MTGKPTRLTAPALGLWPTTRPRSVRLVRARRIRPTEQRAARIRCFATARLSPIKRGTRQRAGGGGGGEEAEEAAEAAAVAEVAEAEEAEVEVEAEAGRRP